MESASSEGSVLVVAESISSIRGFFSKFPSLFDEEELPNTEKYLFIFLFCLKSEFPATVTKPLPHRAGNIPQKLNSNIGLKKWSEYRIYSNNIIN